LDDIEDLQQFLNDNFDATHIVETIDEEVIRQRVLQEVPNGTVIQQLGIFLSPALTSGEHYRQRTEMLGKN
jgi:hypothetical protein